MGVLLKTGGTSSGCDCAHAGFRWRSNWEASLPNPCLCSISFHRPRHLNSRAPYDGAVGRSSVLVWACEGAAPPSRRPDSWSGDLNRLLSFCRSPRSRSTTPSVAFFLAFSPTPTHCCDRAGSPAWGGGRHLCSLDCWGDLQRSGLCFHWTGWITDAPPWLGLHQQAPCLRRNWAHA